MAGDINVSSGDTAQVPIYFFTELSGIYTITATLHTTDPFNTTHTVTRSWPSLRLAVRSVARGASSTAPTS